MTALKKYQRLESPGLWRDSPEAQRREVVVAFREATLVLSDPRTELPLSHWSLPAVERLNPGTLPALYGPAPDSDETLELDDPDMIAALETVRGAVRKGTPRPGRLRGSLLGGATLAILAICAFFLPDALVRHTAAVLPPATRAQIGTAALADISRLTGAPCSTTLGDRALGLLSERLFGDAGVQLAVLPEALAGAAALPGNILLLGRPMLTAAASPEVPAGFALTEALRAETEDPMIPILHHAGFAATVRLLTTGSLPEGALDGLGEAFLAAPRPPLPDEPLLARFDAADVSSAPYGFALDPTGESTLGLIEADPHRNGSPRPLLTPEDWATLQAICP
ncbi:hypothetical protein [Paragemmobacter ruber]|uniref:Uncharacterized protein n=1 Tax=Paragemmobacter ruber TaxID=1985673 RepID=A0ABW9Y5V1_9RHOB|nr:hypothetical protein [Rhodobacter ruber]NBE07933.1 hypothetical protein [Rhodobacter ruber]